MAGICGPVRIPPIGVGGTAQAARIFPVEAGSNQAILIDFLLQQFGESSGLPLRVIIYSFAQVHQIIAGSPALALQFRQTRRAETVQLYNQRLRVKAVDFLFCFGGVEVTPPTSAGQAGRETG